MTTHKNIGGPSLEAGASKPGKLGAKATVSSGVEISVYVKPANDVAAVTTSVTATIVGMIKAILTPTKESF